MKWIKLFEGFDKSEYYTNITEHELKNIVHSGISDFVRLEDINLNYLNILKSEYHLGVNMYMGWSEKLSSIFGSPFGSGESKIKIIVMDILGLRDPSVRCYGEIMAFNDEWFVVYIFDYVTQSVGIWKCDQFEGLVELLKDKNIII
jgi:hypothetical protein